MTPSMQGFGCALDGANKNTSQMGSIYSKGVPPS